MKDVLAFYISIHIVLIVGIIVQSIRWLFSAKTARGKHIESYGNYVFTTFVLGGCIAVAIVDFAVVMGLLSYYIGTIL